PFPQKIRQKKQSVRTDGNLHGLLDQILHGVLDFKRATKVTKLPGKPFKDQTSVICGATGHEMFFRQKIIEDTLFAILNCLVSDNTNGAAVFYRYCRLSILQPAAAQHCKASIT